MIPNAVLDAMIKDLRNVLIPGGYPVSQERVREAADIIENLRAALYQALAQDSPYAHEHGVPASRNQR